MQTIIRTVNVGTISSQAKISVTDVATQYTPPAGTRGVKFQVQGTSDVWEGGSGVSPATNNGIYWIPDEVAVYETISDNFSVYFRCAAGETSTIGVVTW
jgi:hypothetical protein